MWLALRNILTDKARSAKEWKSAMNQFADMFGDQFTGVTALIPPHTQNPEQVR